MRLIGIAGPARSGKDTVAEILRAERWVTIAIADPLKAMMRAGLGSDIYDGDKEQPIEWLGISPRELDQTLGTEWGRNMINRGLWIMLTERRIQGMAQVAGEELNIALTDVRFENEAEWIRAHGGAIWHLVRGDRPSVRAHSSEAGIGMEPEDQVIYNDGTIDDLIYAVADALRHIDDRAAA